MQFLYQIDLSLQKINVCKDHAIKRGGAGGMGVRMGAI